MKARCTVSVRLFQVNDWAVKDFEQLGKLLEPNEYGDRKLAERGYTFFILESLLLFAY